MPSSPSDPHRSDDLIASRLRGAVDGDLEAQAWLIERFTPALMVAARRHVDRHGSRFVDAEDLVQETWAVAWPRLGGVVAEPGTYTPVLLKYLSQTLLNVYRNLGRKHMRRSIERLPQPASATDPMHRLPDPTSGIVTKAARDESHARIRECLQRLDDVDRDVVLLRAFEQANTREAAAILGMPAATVSTRYRRALIKLKRQLPETFLADLPLDPTSPTDPERE